MKKNNKLLSTSVLKTNLFIHNQHGGVLILFAFLLPLFFACFAVAINNAQMLRAKALISESTNEASLAIVALHNQNDDVLVNQKLAAYYINYYLTGSVSDDNYTNVEVEYEPEQYYVSYHHDINFLIQIDKLSELLRENEQDPNVTSLNVSNRKDAFGNARKEEYLISSDIGFIVDFSGSITCSYNDTTCNQYTASNSDKTRLEYIRDTLNYLVTDSPNIFNFALIPYDVGVPVLDEDNAHLTSSEYAYHYTSSEDKTSYACSVLYKLNSPYDELDYDFWANEPVLYTRWAEYVSSGDNNYLTFDYFSESRHNNAIFYYLDYYHYLYYAKVLGPALGYASDTELVSNGLCSKKYMIDSINLGEYIYQCDYAGSDDYYPLTSANKAKIAEILSDGNRAYGAMVQLYDYMYSGNYANTHYSFANTKTVDVSGTINTLFSDINNNTITFTHPVAPAMGEFSPLMGMCQAPLFSNSMMVGEDDKLAIADVYANAANGIANFKATPHLIPFTSDESNNLTTYLKSGTSWEPGGGTDTITALLRSVPVFAEATGDNKIMIIITDGKDDTGADVLRDDFLDAGVCQTIVNGLKSETYAQAGYIANAATRASIHYIKLDPAAELLNDNSADADYESVYGKWFTKCMNKDRQYLHYATDYDSLANALKSIVYYETGVFIQRN